MANIKSQEKRIDIYARNEKLNSSKKSCVRKQIKKVENFVKEGKKAEASEALKTAISLLDKYAQDGALTVNSANRKKAHLCALVNGLE